ncbi:MAG: tetratricopeptide repeat protein [Actinomycetota bacterium]|nr:tetratricopeptide repeat protein [Actinomycetota bacterium]
MSKLSRRLLAPLAVFGLALVMLLGAGVAFTDAPPAPPRDAQPRGASTGPAEVAARDDLAATVTTLQSRLRRLPGDWDSWAALGAAYVQQARITADPTYYAKAEGALRRSLEERPDDNAAAFTGLAALAVARHDFAAGLRLARRAERLNPYSAAALGVRSDALIELGRYEEAFAALQRMVDLKPGVASFTRASYSYELRGDLRGARYALRQALDLAGSPADAAYAAYYLGELAWNSGDVRGAARHYADGLRRDPSFTPLLAGRAKVAAARGRTEQALRDYRTVVERLPQPSYVIEYADLLTSLGRDAEATRQHALVAAEQELFRSQGVNVDLELALYDADHGRPGPALQAARAEWDRRRSVHVEDAYAWALHVNGRPAEALPHAAAAERLGTRSALFAYHRGVIEAALGQDGAARRSLSRALRINPHFSVLHAPRAKQLLSELNGD